MNMASRGLGNAQYEWHTFGQLSSDVKVAYKCYVLTYLLTYLLSGLRHSE